MIDPNYVKALENALMRVKPRNAQAEDVPAAIAYGEARFLVTWVKRHCSHLTNAQTVIRSRDEDGVLYVVIAIGRATQRHYAFAFDWHAWDAEYDERIVADADDPDANPRHYDEGMGW